VGNLYFVNLTRLQRFKKKREEKKGRGEMRAYADHFNIIRKEGERNPPSLSPFLAC